MTRIYELRICPVCAAQWIGELGPGCHAEDPITVPAVRVYEDEPRKGYWCRKGHREQAGPICAVCGRETDYA